MRARALVLSLTVGCEARARAHIRCPCVHVWQTQCTLCLIPGAGSNSLPLPCLMVRAFITDGGHGNQTVGHPKPVHTEREVQQALLDMHCLKFRSSAELELEDGMHMPSLLCLSRWDMHTLIR